MDVSIFLCDYESFCNHKKWRKDVRTDHLLQSIKLQDFRDTKWEQINIKTKDVSESITHYLNANGKIDLQIQETIWFCRNFPTLISTL